MGKHKTSGLSRGVYVLLAIAAALVSLAVTAALLYTMVLQVGQPKKAEAATSAQQLDVTDKFHMYTANQISDALGDTLSIDKVYWIGRNAKVAPKPNPACFGETDDPSSLQWLLDDAGKLLDGQQLYFNTDIELLKGTKVRYYLDDTIFAITWKQVIDFMVFTFSEVKIAHPSQFRRFLAGGKFGSEEVYVTTEMAKSVNAVLASSGDYYRFRDVGVVVYDGKVRRVNNGMTDTCYIDNQGDLHFSYVKDKWTMESAQKFVDDNDINFSLVFGPVLIRDGEICVPRHYALGEIDENYPRAALCQMDKLHYIVAMQNAEQWYTYEPTMDQFAWQISKTGCKQAYALDGGQTASIAFNGELVNNVMYGYQRWHSDIIYFATAIPSDE